MARTSKGWNSSRRWPAGRWWNRAATCAAWWAWARTVGLGLPLGGLAGVCGVPLRLARGRGVNPEAWDVLDLLLALLFAAVYFYFYAFGVHFQDRALSRASALAFLVLGAWAVVIAARILR